MFATLGYTNSTHSIYTTEVSLLSLKPSISTHSKPRMRLLKCFVLQHSVIKAKHLRSLVQGVVRGFKWVEILGLSMRLALLHSRLIFIIWHEQKIPNFNHNLAPILPMRKEWAFEHRRHPNTQVTNINSTLSSLTTEVALLSLSLACFMRDWFSSFDVNGKFRISKLFD